MEYVPRNTPLVISDPLLPNISEGAAKMTVTRMRQRFRAIIRQEIAQTVTTPEQLEAELRAFVEALAS